MGRTGKLWLGESFDHIVRSGEQLEYFRKYIADNPEKLRQGEFLQRPCRGGWMIGKSNAEFIPRPRIRSRNEFRFTVTRDKSHVTLATL